MFTSFRPALVLFTALSLLTGVLYPAAVTLLAQALFPFQANGSLIVENGRTMGSALIGQAFTSSGYFWSRPSATDPGYNGAASAGSNLGPSNPALVDAVARRIDALRAAEPENDTPVPIDLVTTSASGLDPHISIAAAYFQVSRVASARQRAASEVTAILDRLAERPRLPGFGEPRVNVLQLNLALDRELR